MRKLGDAVPGASVGLVFLFACSLLAGCASPQRSDAFFSPDAGFSGGSIGRTALLYLPNRLVDLVDIVHVGYGIGPGFGVEIHPTGCARLGAVAGLGDVGLAWLGRRASPLQADALYARASAGSHEAKAGISERRWRFPQWDIGVHYHALLDMAYVGIAPDEVVDFVAGLVTYDTKKDDF